MTASMLAAAGIAAQGQDAIVSAMPLLTLLTALFLLLLSWAGAGRLIRRMPLPVMHGFIFGIALTVVIGQVPLLLGTTAPSCRRSPPLSRACRAPRGPAPWCRLSASLACIS